MCGNDSGLLAAGCESCVASATTYCRWAATARAVLFLGDSHTVWEV